MKKQHWFTLFVLSLLVMTAADTPIAARRTPAPQARATGAPALLQFTSSGHVVGFARDAVYVANGEHAYRVEFVGAVSTVPVADSAQTDTGRAAPLSRVTYPNLWQGITLTYDAPEGAILRSTYRVEPFADAAQIRLRYNVPAQIENDGTLALAYDTGVMRESAPVAWQEIGGARVPVQVAFHHLPLAPGNREVGFAVGAYDSAYPLFIDPMLTWNTFLGTEIWVVGDAITVDGYGNVYVAGTSNVTWGALIRAHSGNYDAFVAKLNSSSGELIWNTFLGGSGVDYGHAVAVDLSGNIYVAGESTATWQGTNPPVRAYTGGFDAFVAKLDSSGVLWNTFLGGSVWDEGLAITVEGSDVYVAGRSRSTWGSPTRAYTSGTDAFVARLDKNTGALGWNTFLGGSGDDWSAGIAAGGGNVWVGGTSNASWQGTSAPKRLYSGGYDVFVAHLDYTDGDLVWNTFLGGSGNDYGGAIAMWGGHSVYVAGHSDASWQGTSAPIRAYTGGFDAFVAKLVNGGLTWNTFLGGSSDDLSGSIAVDSSGNNVYVAGSSNATWDSPIRAYTGDSDAFAAKLSNSGSLTWHTFLGGNFYDGGYGIVPSGSNVYVVGTSNASWGTPVRAYTTGLNAFASQLDSSGALGWNTFLGGVATDAAYAIAIDWSSNSIYVAGYSDATWGSPVRGYTGGMDAFVAKLNNNGTLIWHAFLGGTQDDVGKGVTTDVSGNAYVVGISYATWQGTSPPVRAYQGSVDAFVAKLDSSGVLVWNTFLGGTGFDRGLAIAWSGSNELYVAGDSDVSWGSPTRPYQGSGDAFAARLNSSTGALVWNTFLGSSSGDAGCAISADASAVYVAGTSTATWQGTNPPVRAYQGNGDAFAAKLSKSNGAVVWNTFLGGNGVDYGYAILGTVTHVHVAGRSNATWQGTTGPVRGYTSGIDTFVADLDSNGNLIWNTFLGGSGDDLSGSTIGVDEYGYVYVTGYSPTTWGSPLRAHQGGADAFAAKLSYSSGTLIWNTFLGGSGNDEGYAIVVEGVSRQVFVVGRSNATWGAPIRAHNGDWDAFVAQLAYRIFLPLIMR
jgi:hypothetical protein